MAIRPSIRYHDGEQMVKREKWKPSMSIAGYIYTHTYMYRLYIIYVDYIYSLPVWNIYFSHCPEQGRKQPPSAMKSRLERLQKWSRT